MQEKKDPIINELLVVEIIRTSEILNHRINRLLKDYELTNPQYNILRILRGANGDISVGQVKERMLFSTSDVSRLLDRLVKKGLIHRNICPDNRRKMDVTISKIGLQVLEKLDVEMARALDGFYEKEVSKKEAEEIISKLKLISSIED